MSSLPSVKNPSDFPFSHEGQADSIGVSYGGDYVEIQQLFDSRADFNQEQINAIINALLSIDGANNVQMSAIAGVIADNGTVQTAIETLKTLLDEATTGTLPDRSINAIKIALNTLTEDEMSASYKKQAGGVAEYDTVATNTTNIATNTTNLDIARTAKVSTGSASTYSVDTDGTFAYTKDGNRLDFIPNHTNTGTSTLDIDGVGAKNILKPDGVGGTTALEAGDITEGIPVTVYRRVTGDFFLLAPKGGKNPMNDWINSTSVSQLVGSSATTSRISISGSGWVVGISNPSTTTNNFVLNIDGTPYIGNNSASEAAQLPDESGTLIMARFETGFEFYDVQNKYEVAYVLGDKFEEAIPKIAIGSTLGSTTTTQINVTGEGWFYGGQSRGSNVEIIIDSTSLNSASQMQCIVSLFKFNNSLRIDDSATVGQGTYYNYTLI